MLRIEFARNSNFNEYIWFVFRVVWWLWNLTGTSTALLSMCLSNCKAIRWVDLQISQLQDFMGSYDKMSYRILKRGPRSQNIWGVCQEFYRKERRVTRATTTGCNLNYVFFLLSLKSLDRTKIWANILLNIYTNTCDILNNKEHNWKQYGSLHVIYPFIYDYLSCVVIVINKSITIYNNAT